VTLGGIDVCGLCCVFNPLFWGIGSRVAGTYKQTQMKPLASNARASRVAQPSAKTPSLRSFRGAFREDSGLASNPTAAVRIVVADLHPVVLQGTARIFSQLPDFSLSGTISSGRELKGWFLENTCDVLILDFWLAQSEGLSLIRALKRDRSARKIIAFSTSRASEYEDQAVKAGADAYVTKCDSPESLVLAARTVAMSCRPSECGGRMPSRTSRPGVGNLSDGELRVFFQIGEGRRTREIATHLHLSHKTVETHRENIKRKVGIDSLERLISMASIWNACSGLMPMLPSSSRTSHFGGNQGFPY